MNRRRRIGSVDGESALPELPEAMIQHIQSYMSGKEAARTTLLSKSWHSAWLTRPTLDFDAWEYFRRGGVGNFEKFATKAMRRYRKLGLKIERFRLVDRYSCNLIKQDFCRKLIVKAMKIGATDLQLEMDRSFALPKQVLRSQTLVKLSLTDCKVDGRYAITCPALKSLTFNHVTFTNSNGDDDDVVFCNILTSCNASLEELSLSNLTFSRMSTCELHKLRRLFLISVNVDVTVFSNDFASRLPCLEELSILDCDGCTRLRIASTSLQTISYKPWRHWSSRGWSAKFDVPNIRKFSYSGWGSPASKLSIKAEASREWEFDMSIHCNQLYKNSWFLNLKKYLTKYRLSRTSIFVNIVKSDYWCRPEQEVEVEVEVAPKPMVVDNLMIDRPSSYLSALLVRLFGICRPKLIAHCLDHDKVPIDFLCERWSMFGLKEVKVELLPLDASQIPANKQKIRYHLIWNE